METLKIYKCFISSPGDCDHERKLCLNVIKDINNSEFAKHQCINFNSFMWENDVLPDMGKNGQKIIDEQIEKSNYDIFIGIMKNRFGHPTKKAGSGTEHEFNDALKRKKSLNDINSLPRILFFFCKEKVYPDDMDREQFEQYEKVKEFKSKIRNKGLYIEIKEEDSFETIVKEKLELFIRYYSEIKEDGEQDDIKETHIKNPTKKELTKFEKIANDEIIGREKELNEIHNILFDDKKVIIVNGLGGIGKTMLAQAYASKFYNDYKYIAWITQGDEPAIKAFINNKELIKNLGLDYSELSRYEENEQVKRILTRHSNINDKPNLLVIDNSDKTICDIKQYLPGTPDWHVLITSREEIGIERNCVNKKLDFLSKENAFELFKKHCDIKIYSDDQIYTLLKTIEYHTLTIEILAKTAMLRRTKFDKILRALEDDLKASISLSRETEQIDRVTTYLKSIFNFTKLDENEIWILKQFCFLPPDYHKANIIETLFQIEKLKWFEDFYMALNTLVKKGWLLYNKETDSFKMHRIIYEVAIAKIPPLYEDVKLLFSKIGEKLNSEEDADDYLEHTEWIPFGENVLELIEKYQVFNQFANKLETYTIQKNIGWLYDETDEKEKGKIVLERALESSINDLGFENTFVTDCQSKLGMILNNLGDTEKAKMLLEQAVEADIKILKKNDPLLALHRNNLAVIYASIEEYEKALDLIQVVIDSEIKKFGDSNQRLAVRYSVLAEIYSGLDEDEKAIKYSEKSLEIYQLHFPENHPNIAHALYRLGIRYFIFDKQKAKEALERAFSIYSEHFKENSNHVALAEYFLGLIYFTEIKDNQNKIEIEKACSFLERSLSTRIEKDGIDSLAAAQIQYFLGPILYYAKEEKERGINLLETALKTRSEKLGETHEDVADVQFKLGEVYSDLDNNEKAKELLEKALLTRIEKLEENHKDVADVQFKLGEVYSDLDNNEEAKELLEKALKTRIEILGENHKDSYSVKLYLGMVYFKLGDQQKACEIFENILRNHITSPIDFDISIVHYMLAKIYMINDGKEKAKDLLEKALPIRIEKHGEEHENVVEVQFELGKVYYQLDENEKARDIFEKVLAFSVKKYPEDDHNIGDVLLELGQVYSDLNEKKKASELLEQSLAIHIKTYGEEHVHLRC